jgi:steroid delta-isomerase-like uncharacterized protein
MGVGEVLVRAWSTHDGHEVARAFAEDGVREEFILPRAVLRGREAIAAQIGMYMTAVPDCRLEVRREVIGADGTVTLEWTWGGTHSGDVEGWPARGEIVRLPGVALYDLDGTLIRRENIYADMAIMLAGAGLIPGAEVRPEP